MVTSTAKRMRSGRLRKKFIGSVPMAAKTGGGVYKNRDGDRVVGNRKPVDLLVQPVENLPSFSALVISSHLARLAGSRN